jgi:xanthine dehydrogenase YagT iron-sulfur-binding subunit
MSQDRSGTGAGVAVVFNDEPFGLRLGKDACFVASTAAASGDQAHKPNAMPDQSKPNAGKDDAGAPGKLSRRDFISRLGTSSIIAGAVPLGASLTEAADVKPAATGSPQGLVQVTLTVNGTRQTVQIDPRSTLLDTLRETLHLTGTKKGCDHGQCGACTVHVNGERVNSCLCLALAHEGDEITTIEGLGEPGHLHPMQAAFLACDGYQCGYCTSGQIMSAVALTKEPCGRADADVKEAMSGNICRCGAYPNIVAAIQQARPPA